MADLFREVDEALREDRAKTLWDRYGSLVIALAAALVLGTAGFAFWQNHQAQQNQERSAMLAQVLTLAEENPAEAADQFAALAASGGNQALLARFYEAGLRAEAGHSEAAVDLYREIAGDSSVSGTWRDLARLLAVMHGLDDDDPAVLEAELAPLAAADSPWRFSAREMTGLLALRQGDTERARTLFAELADAPDAPAGVRARAGELAALLSERGGE
jgi:hypothetical protein